MKYYSLVCFLLLQMSHLQAQMLGDLIPSNTATHTAVQDGSWFDANTWDANSVPSDAAIVYIPSGKSVTYEGQSSAHIFAIRVDGNFTCTQTNNSATTSLTFDTFIATSTSYVKFHANAATDGKIDAFIKPFDIEAHKAGTSAYTLAWSSNASNHFSDDSIVYQITQSVGPDKRFNSYAEALAGNTTMTELSRVAYDDGAGVTGRYAWDSTQLSLGIITMGQLEILGQEKLGMSKLAADAAKGQKVFQLEDIPTGWNVGDTILVTRGGNISTVSNGDDVEVIAQINGTTITCVTNLGKNHEGRAADNLHCYAGNLTRNITFQSTNTGNIHHRGHLMAMHNDLNVQIKNASFKNMGRTDKSRLLDDFIWKQWLEPSVFKCKISALGQEVCEMERNDKADITNSRGRYSIHLHKTGTAYDDNMLFVTGNVVWGNPGWGITHHDSYATIADNVVYDVIGAGIVSESGSEIGFWDDNLVVDVQKGHTESPYTAALFHDDYLYSGQGFGMKGRAVVCRNNVIVNVQQGVGVINMNPSTTNHDRVDAKALATLRPNFTIDNFPLSTNGYSSEGDGVMPVEVALIMENTTIIDVYQGLRSIERDMGVNHESRSVFDGFKVWGAKQGLSIVYQADYSFKDVFLSGDGTGETIGIFIWKHSHNHLFENIKMVDLDYGVQVSKLVESDNGDLKTRNNGFTPWIFVDLSTENVGDFYQIKKEDESTATVYTEHSDNPIHLNSSDLVSRPTSFTILDSTALVVDYAASDFRFEVDGIVTDDLGAYDMGIDQAEAQGTLRIEYPERIYEFASAAKFEAYLTANGVYKDTANNDQLYFIINELLPNRRTFQYTPFPVRVKIMNAPSSGIFASPQIENPANLVPQYQLVSRSATVTQSSTNASLSYDGDAIDASATKAIDGNNNGRINCQHLQQGLLPLGSFSQTNDELEPWLDVDLGETKTIDYIDLWNTVELNGQAIETNSSHFQDFYVLIADVPFGNIGLTAARSLADYEYYTAATASPKRKVSFNSINAVGRYVRIQAVGTTRIKLAELEIIGKTYGPSVILPVELVRFEAQAHPNQQQNSFITWTTLTEVNSAIFEIQHAIDGQTFETIGQQKAQGFSTEKTDYAFLHLNPILGQNFYRLKMIDQDGSFEYSPIKIVVFETDDFLNIYPQPAKQLVHIETTAVHTPAQIIDNNGKILKSFIVPSKHFTLNTQQWANGIYILKIGNTWKKIWIAQ